MPIRVLLADLRNGDTILTKGDVNWISSITARKAISEAISESIAVQVADDLSVNNKELTVSWSNKNLEAHSEVGGVADLNWIVENNSMIVISYEDASTTDAQVDESSNWMSLNEL